MKKISTFIILMVISANFLVSQTTQATLELTDQKNISNALNFDGIDDYVSIPNGTGIFANLDAFSMCGWVYPTNPNANWPDFDGYFGIKDEGVCDFYIVQVNGTSLEVRITTDQGQFTIPGSELSQVTLNEWQHFAVVYTGSELQLYFNGALDGSVAASGIIPYNNLEVTIGKVEYFETDFYLDGKVDEVTFWDKALNADEVMEYQCISGDPGAVPNLNAYYNFNEEEGLVLPDYFENYNGTLTNMTGNEWIESDVCQSGYDILFVVTDEISGDPVQDANINLNGIIKTTNENGEANYNNYDPGVYPYEVTKTDYYNATGEVEVVEEDIVEEVILSPILEFDITFIVTEDPGGISVDSAIVNMSGIIQYTDETGQATFTGFLPGTYPYVILKDGYTLVQGDAEVIDEDLIIEISLLLNNIAAYDEIGNWLIQNPVNHKMLISSNSSITGDVLIGLFNLDGKLLMRKKLNSQYKMEIDLSSLKEGIYLLRIETNIAIETKKIVLKN